MSKNENVHCYECLKTRGFAISIMVALAAISFVAYIIFGNPPVYIWTVIVFILFWTLVVAFLGIAIPAFVAHSCIKAYCNKSSSDYKDPAVIAIFAVATIISIVVLLAAIATFQSNYDHFFTPDENGCYRLIAKWYEVLCPDGKIYDQFSDYKQTDYVTVTVDDDAVFKEIKNDDHD